MTFKECMKKFGIISDCNTVGSRWGTYEVQFVNSETGEADFVTFDIVGAGTASGDAQCAELFQDFCKTEGIRNNQVTEIHITRASASMADFRAA